VDRWLDRGLRIAAYCALAALLAALWVRRDDALALVRGASPDLLVGSSLLLVAVFLIDAAGWVLILRRLGERRIAFRRGCWVWMVSSLSRYLPGGFWPYASRVAMAREVGVKTGVAALSLVLETILLGVSALAVGLPALAMAIGAPVSPFVAAVGIVLGLGVLHPQALATGRYLPGRLGRMMAEIRPVPYREVLWLFAYYLAFWVLFGVAFMLFAQSLAIDLPLLQATSSFALAFLAGFVALFAPGGIGVREAAIYLLLAPQVGATAALTLSVASRLWIMVGELASLGLTAALGRVGSVENRESGS
jgi:uncharacterized membrane protein YbhN (UPF0104 family)